MISVVTVPLAYPATVFEEIKMTVPYSVPDCRNYGDFPNQSRNVQGTLIYDVPNNPNAPILGVVGDVLVPANYAGSGLAEIATFNSGQWLFGDGTSLGFGTVGDIA